MKTVYTIPAPDSLGAQIKVYGEPENARAEHPQRWSGKTRNWEPVGAINLNPERPVQMAA